MSIYVKNGVLHVDGAQDKLRQKGQEKPDFLSNYTMLDIETTGLSPFRDRITELGGVKVRNGQIVDQYTNLVKFPKNNKVPAFITKLLQNRQLRNFVSLSVMTSLLVIMLTLT